MLFSPLLQACINGHEDVARLLLDQGASVDYQDTDNWTGAHFASAHGHSSILHLLFEVSDSKSQLPENDSLCMYNYMSILLCACM